MKYLSHLLVSYPYTVALFAVVWYLSLGFIPEHMPLNDVKFIDKWTHIVMYGGTCTVLWWEYWRRHKHGNARRLLLLAWAAPIAMSGLLELLQEYCTGGRRSGEWLDLAANATGVTRAAAIGALLLSRWARR